MNILFWVLQGLLAAHTLMGALWKFSHPEQTVPSLKAIPHGVWIAMSGIEILCALGLLVPAISKNLGMLAPIAALCIAGEMLFMTAVHLSSGATSHGQMIYWLVVALFCALIAYGRLVISPL